MITILLLITPCIAAILSALFRKGVTTLAIIAGVATALEGVFSFILAKEVYESGTVTTGNLFSIDALGILTIATVAIVGVCVSLYSIGYMRLEVEKRLIGFRRVRQYYVLLHLFLLAMYFAVATTLPILMWVMIEATTLSTAFLVSFYNKPSAMEAAWKYLVINSIGLLLAFLGTLLFFSGESESLGGFVTWSALASSTLVLNPLIVKIAFIFVLIGYGTKVGFAPMHTWKPDAYSKAPTPVVALFSGALLNVALFALLRFKIITDIVVGVHFSQILFLSFGLLSLTIAAFIIFTQWNYKRLLAYSSVEHAGIMALGFGFGGIGTFAAILHMIYHAFAKSALFFAAGNMLLKFSSTKISQVRGAFIILPVTSIIFFMGFLAATGIPPFGTFLTELYIITAGLSSYPWIAGVAIVMLALVFIGFLQHVLSMLFGAPDKELPHGDSEFSTLLPPLVLLAILLVFGFFLPAPIYALVETAARSITP
jgi:hydrogenase-4 component F